MYNALDPCPSKLISYCCYASCPRNSVWGYQCSCRNVFKWDRQELVAGILRMFLNGALCYDRPCVHLDWTSYCLSSRLLANLSFRWSFFALASDLPKSFLVRRYPPKISIPSHLNVLRVVVYLFLYHFSPADLASHSLTRV